VTELMSANGSERLREIADSEGVRGLGELLGGWDAKALAELRAGLPHTAAPTAQRHAARRRRWPMIAARWRPGRARRVAARATVLVHAPAVVHERLPGSRSGVR
jgi:hypothetical protein